MSKTVNFIVLMMGYTGSGKSTVAKKLAASLKAEIYHSAVIRKELGYNFTKEEAESDFFLMTSKKREPMDKAVYAEMAKKCRESLLQGKNVILDASHFFRWQRENLYLRIKDLNPDIFIIKVECPEEEIIRRLKKRLDDFSESNFNETPSIRAYHSGKIAMESPDGDQIGNKTIIRYDSSSKSIKLESNGTNSNLNPILSALK